MTLTRPSSRILPLLYLVIGIVVASSHHYFEHANTWRQILSAVLAIVLWPLLMLGIDLHVH